MDAPVRRYEWIVLPKCRRGQWTPRTNWNEVIRHDLRNLGQTKDMAQEKKLW